LLGIEPGSALEVLRGSAAYSKQMDSKGPKMVEGDYSVQARLSQHLKDVVLMLRSAERMGLELRLTQTHRGLLEQAQEDGYGEQDNSAVYASMRRRARRLGDERDA
jgi:3-hydroxyisobutyrate dehydrogenase-like beta-hydroxyacid dehydrogenase